MVLFFNNCFMHFGLFSYTHYMLVKKTDVLNNTLHKLSHCNFEFVDQIQMFQLSNCNLLSTLVDFVIRKQAVFMV